MPKQLPILQLRNHVSGVIHEDAVDDFLQPENSVNEAINLHFDQMGAVKLRPGTTRLGNQISSGTDILGLHQFLDEGAGTNDRILAVNGTKVYYNNAGTWTQTRGGLTTGKKARFTNFIDRVLMVNGTDVPLGWNGNTGDTWKNTNLAGAPLGHFIENFRSRVWILGTDSNPSRIE